MVKTLKYIFKRLRERFSLPYDSIFRKVRRPTFRVKTEYKQGSNWMITYTICDVCKKEATTVEYVEKEDRWKCLDCLKEE